MLDTGGQNQLRPINWRIGYMTTAMWGASNASERRKSRVTYKWANWLPPPPCISYPLVQGTVGVGTLLIWGLFLIRYQT